MAFKRSAVRSRLSPPGNTRLARCLLRRLYCLSNVCLMNINNFCIWLSFIRAKNLLYESNGRDFDTKKYAEKNFSKMYLKQDAITEFIEGLNDGKKQ